MSQVKETYNINLFDIQGNDSKLTQSPYVRFDVDFTLRVSDCEELVGVTHEKMMGLPLPRVLVFEVVIA